MLQGVHCTLCRRKRPPTPILEADSGPGPGLQIDFDFTEELSKSCKSKNTWRNISPSLEFWQTYYPNQYLSNYNPL